MNIKGTFHICVAAINQFRAQKTDGVVNGRIVNITFVAAFKAHPQNSHYAATKAAVVSLIKSFAHEVAPDNILVNSVAPAGMATQQARTLGFLHELAAASPLGRCGELREMAEWVLMADENIIVSGGYIYASFMIWRGFQCCAAARSGNFRRSGYARHRWGGSHQ